MARPSLVEVVLAARDLKSEDGENFEYDRALIELSCAVLGWDMDRKREMADLIGMPTRVTMAL
jgi:hypothetical protein